MYDIFQKYIMKQKIWHQGFCKPDINHTLNVFISYVS